VDPSFEWYFVIQEDQSGPGVSETYCRIIRRTKGLTMPVLRDPDGRLNRAFGLNGHHNHFVFGPDMELLYRRGGRDDQAEAAVRAELQR